MSLTRRQRVRRVALLCCHFLRNLAFYKTGWDWKSIKRKDPFWVTVNGNFLDHCVLEFCKLFADKKGKHHWRKVVTDQGAFEAELLAELKMTAAELAAYVETMKAYRDKFIAHLDLDEIMHIPYLNTGRKAVSYLYDHLRDHEDDDDFLPDAMQTATDFYEAMADETDGVYK